MASKKSSKKKVQSKHIKCCLGNKAKLIVLIALIAVAAFIFLWMINEITGWAVTTCTDSDNGRNYLVMGTTKSGKSVFTDYCSGNTLYEGYCSRNKIARITYTCGAGYQCLSGACQIPPTATPAPSPAA
ncbi:MAG: hypothetical protein NTV63_02190 [Candidatus Woesearchaeota archaeon]|nr:hypothetical protein [Candidatus Woesearchaeota archaeon]